MEDLDLSILGIAAENNDFQGESPLEVEIMEPPDPIVTKYLRVASEKLPEKLSNLEDIQGIWLSSRSPAEIAAQAQTMPFGVWMDYAIKLSPKQVKMSGKMDVRAAFVNLGPPKR